MRQILSKVWHHDFMRHNLTLFVSAMVLAVLNYIYHPILGRLLSVEEYGEAQTLIALFLNLGIVAGVLMSVMNNVTAKYRISNPGGIIFLLKHFSRLGVIFGTLLTFVILITSPLFQSFFSMPSIWPILALSTLGLPLFINSVYRGVLQGLHDFSGWSMNQILVAFAKLLLAVGLVLAGLSVSGVILALFLSECLGLVIIQWQVYRQPVLLGVLENQRFDENKKALMAYGIQVFLTSLGMMLLFTIDIFIVKRLFSPTEAGLYSGVAAVAKIVFFVSGSVLTVLFPYSSGQKERQKIIYLLYSVLWIITLGGGIVCLFNLFPEEFMYLLMGSQYLSYSHFLPKLSWVLLLYTLLKVCNTFLLAQRDQVNLYIIFSIFVPLLAAISIGITSIDQLIQVLLFSFGLGNFLFMTYISYNYWYQLRTLDLA